MIPIKLAMRNFMPYHDNVPPLYFDGIHIASICGNNGNGKSALIEAMTWALWGKARGKSDDDLIHLGETEMEVELDFAVGQQKYRVIRKHARPKRKRASGQTILEFQIATGDGFRPISGNTISQTQQAIIKVIHIDYTTFINSALLLQGRADEFTVANPAKRKQVLADILGLALYDELEAKAREIARHQETEKSLLESNIQEINDELAHQPEYEAELEQAQNELTDTEKVIREKESLRNELRQRKEHLSNRQTQLIQLEEHVAEQAGVRQRWQDQRQQHQSRINEYQETINRRSIIEDGYSRFISTRESNNDFNQKLTLLNRLNQGKHEMAITIERAQSTLVTEHRLAESKISELEAGFRKLPGLQDELQQEHLRQSQLAEEEEILKQRKRANRELQAHILTLNSNPDRLRRELVEIDEKLSLLSTQTEAKCPLCERELEMDSLGLIRTKYDTDKHDKADSLQSGQSELIQSTNGLQQMESAINQAENRLNQSKTAAQSKIGLINQQIAETEKTREQLGEESGRLSKIEDRLAHKDFAAIEQQKLNQLEEEIAKLDYHPAQHEEIRRRQAELEQYESPQRKLEEADRLINQERKASSNAEQAIEELDRHRADDTEKRQELAAELSSLSRVVTDFDRVEQEYQTLVSQQKRAQEIVWGIKAKLQHCFELEKRRQEKTTLLGKTAKDEKIYRDLAQAFGKKGIQALLIEMALPEIEIVANSLLGRMTDNRMHVKIETQRETKKGDVLETLDINISDELGTRNYEMYSGGDAFRINFAIRIALSKLLAKRAGAPLPTLIIDEGFGTQDSAGLEKIQGAITSIQDDFDKIFVITHIEELRDAFPAHIDIIKTAEGSTIEVS